MRLHVEAVLRWETRMDPAWFFSYDTEELRRAAATVSCLTALVAGQHSHVVRRLADMIGSFC